MSSTPPDADGRATNPPGPPDRGETLRMPVAVLEELRAHARDEAPHECCGLLVGTGSEIRRAVRARNVRASPTRYLVHPEDHFRALRSARDDGLAVVGAYHSHPTSPAEPSETDLAEAHDTTLLYVIVSLDQRTPEAVRAYRLAADGFGEVPIAFTP